MDMVWNNTYVGDTVVEPRYNGVYLRNDREGFSCDFLYEMGEAAYLYLDGELEDVNLRKDQLVTYTEEENTEDLAYEGSRFSMMSPMEMIKDSAWDRAGKAGDVVYYEKVINEGDDEEGHSLSPREVLALQDGQLLIVIFRPATVSTCIQPLLPLMNGVG
jgi:hypothetical protein